ncbi:MAG: hypothetical protein Q8S33_26030 [Myxococcales bacterium]|nr:hypothetical protein [Myxococcales bacterium]
MTELSARARALMAQARTDATPTREELAHVRQRLAPELARPPRKPIVVPLPLIAIGLVSALTFGFHSSGVAQSWSFGSRPVQLVCLDDRGPARLERFEAMLDAVDATRSCRSETPAPSPLSAAPLEPRPRVMALERGEPARDVEPMRPVDDLGLGLLEEARLALDEHRPFDALGQVQKHLARYPQSQFHEERLAMQLVAVCMAQRPDLASKPRAEFFSEFPESTYLPRVERACAAVLDGGSFED